jgi:copper ion binding protein
MALTVAAADTLTVRINGMRCSECGHKVKNVLRKSPAIGALDFNYERRTVKIAYDAQQTCTDSIYSMLERTGRYKAKPYDPTEVIRRGYGQRIADMHCQKCYNRISERLSKLEGIDSLAPHLDNQYIFIRYDANRTCRADIRKVLNNLGYTPCNYYSGDKIDFLYLLLPADQANDETFESVLALDGVEDVNVNPKRKAMAITFFTDETTADKLLKEIQDDGIKATLPKPHKCTEEEAKK